MRPFIVGTTALILVTVTAPSALADPLDAEAVESLMFRAPWHIQTGGETNYFIWRDDGGLCVRMFDPSAETCEDQGTWTRDGAQLCYELGWWGAAIETDKLFFTVEPVHQQPVDFHGKDSKGLTALYFSVPEGE